MDAFYASVEQRDRPELRGRPVVVGGDPRGRGVVCAASYEARAFGVRSAMPMARALRLCPQAVIVAPGFERYRAASRTVFDLFRQVTPLVEPLSLDEAYLDVTENSWGEPFGTRVARRLKAAIVETTGLTASAGVAPNKFLAKIASGWKKPDGLTVVPPERVETFLQKLPIDALWGVGPVTARRLRAHGLERLVDVRTRSLAELQAVVGGQASWLLRLAHGIDERPVEPNRPRKSVGTETTFARDLMSLDEIRDSVESLAREVADWLLQKQLFARTITLKVRYGDFTTITRTHSEYVATHDAAALVRRSLFLLEKTEAGLRPIRLLGVSAHNLQSSASSDEADAARRAGARLRRTVEDARLPLDGEDEPDTSGGATRGPASSSPR